MTLIAIIIGTLTAGIGSVWLAAALSFGMLARYTQHMLSLAAGALLATAFMHLLPEAFESQAGAKDLFMTLLVGLVFFSCWTKPNCGTTGMSTTITTIIMTMTMIMPVMPGMLITLLPPRKAHRMTLPMTVLTTPRKHTPPLRQKPAVGPCSPATACIALATAC